jgi:proteasome lid subunit RPN8/RPN11
MQTADTSSKLFDAKRHELVQRRETLIHQLGQASRSFEDDLARQKLEHVERTNEFIATLDGLAQEAREAKKRRRYVVSSLFLHECFRKLTADQDEQFFFVTGTEIDGALVLDQWAEFAHQKRSMMGVTGEPKATHGLLIKLEQFGHRLLGHFHSHPGKGAEATMPSGTDRNFQQRLESAGHVAVMAIFSRDGFIRFVRLDQNLEIEIHGQGVENHAPGIYRLANFDTA